MLDRVCYCQYLPAECKYTHYCNCSRPFACPMTSCEADCKKKGMVEGETCELGCPKCTCQCPEVDCMVKCLDHEYRKVKNAFGCWDCECICTELNCDGFCNDFVGGVAVYGDTDAVGCRTCEANMTSLVVQHHREAHEPGCPVCTCQCPTVNCTEKCLHHEYKKFINSSSGCPDCECLCSDLNCDSFYPGGTVAVYGDTDAAGCRTCGGNLTLMTSDEADFIGDDKEVLEEVCLGCTCECRAVNCTEKCLHHEYRKFINSHGCLDCECLCPDLYYSCDIFCAEGRIGVYGDPDAAGCQPCEGCKDLETTRKTKPKKSKGTLQSSAHFLVVFPVIQMWFRAFSSFHWVNRIQWIMIKSKTRLITRASTYLATDTLPVIVILSIFTLLPLVSAIHHFEQIPNQR